jgi:hypothetical protein
VNDVKKEALGFCQIMTWCKGTVIKNANEFFREIISTPFSNPFGGTCKHFVLWDLISALVKGDYMLNDSQC